MALIASETSKERITIKTDPPLTDAVADQLYASHRKADFQVSQEDGNLVLTGNVFPPNPVIYDPLKELLSEAYDEVQNREAAIEVAHIEVVKKIAEAAKLSITD